MVMHTVNKIIFVNRLKKKILIFRRTRTVFAVENTGVIGCSLLTELIIVFSRCHKSQRAV